MRTAQWKAWMLGALAVVGCNLGIAGTPGDTRTFEVSDCNISYCVIERWVLTLQQDHTWRETERTYRITPPPPPPSDDLPPKHQN